VLADNRSSYNAAVIPQDAQDLPALFDHVATVLNKDPRALARNYKRRHLTPFDPVIIAEDLERKDLIAIEEDRFRYPGLVVEQSFERFYPFHEIGAHVVGFVGRIDRQPRTSCRTTGIRL